MTILERRVLGRIIVTAGLMVISIACGPDPVEKQMLGRWLEEPRPEDALPAKYGTITPKTFEFFSDGTSVLSWTYRLPSDTQDTTVRHHLHWFLADSRRLKVEDKRTGEVLMQDVSLNGDVLTLNGDMRGSYRRQP